MKYDLKRILDKRRVTLTGFLEANSLKTEEQFSAFIAESEYSVDNETMGAVKALLAPVPSVPMEKVKTSEDLKVVEQPAEELEPTSSAPSNPAKRKKEKAESKEKTEEET